MMGRKSASVLGGRSNPLSNGFRRTAGASNEDQFPPRRRDMSKRRIYTQPITRISLYWISMAAIYVVYAAMGGIAILIVFAAEL